MHFMSSTPQSSNDNSMFASDAAWQRQQEVDEQHRADPNLMRRRLVFVHMMMRRRSQQAMLSNALTSPADAQSSSFQGHVEAEGTSLEEDRHLRAGRRAEDGTRSQRSEDEKLALPRQPHG